MPNLLEIGATVDLGQLKSGLDAAADNVRGSVGQMSSSFQALAQESEAATAKISGEWVNAAKASVELSRAQSEVRSASRAARQASEDDSAAVARLAQAKRQAAEASAAQAEAEKAAATALKAEEEAAEKAALTNMSAFARMGVAFREFAESVKEQSGEIAETLVETAEVAKIAEGGMIGGFAGLGQLFGEAVAVSFATHFLDELAKTAVELDHLSAKTGIAVQSLAGLQQVVREMGADFDQVSLGLIKMNKAQQDAIDGNKQALLAFERMGVSLKDLRALAPEQLFYRLSQGFADARSHAAAASSAITIFGRGGTALIPVMREAGSSIEGMVKSAGEASGVTEKAVEDSRQWTQMMAEFTQVMRQAGFIALTVLIPAIKATVTAFEILATTLLTVFEGIAIPLASLAVGLKDIGILIYDAISGNFSKLAGDATLVKDNFLQVWRDGGTELKANWKALRGDFDAIWSKPAHKPELAGGPDVPDAAAGKDNLQQKVAALRKADEDQLAELRLNAAQQGITGQALLQQERKFFQDRLEAESQYADRVRELRKQLATVLIDSLKEFEKGQRLANEAVRQGAEEARKYEEAVEKSRERESKQFIQGLKDEQAALKETQEIEEGRFKAGSEGNVSQLEMQKLAVERQYSLNGGGRTSAQIAELQAMRVIDDQIIAEKLRTARALAEVDKINDPKKYAQELQQIAQLEAQADQKRYAETTRILQLEQQQHEKFFNTITQSFTRGINQWIQHQKTFAQAMAESWNGIVMSVIQNLEKMAAQWIAHELAMTLAHIAGNQARVASDAATASESEGISAAHALKEVMRDAGVAAAHAFKSVMGALPFPANVIVAPIAAAGAFAATMAFAAFEQGGVVPNTGLAMVHGGEMVLPSALSQKVQNWTANSTTHNQGSTVHLNYSPTIHGANSDIKQMLSDHADHITRIVRQKSRSFNR